jgi:hypothetical protein
MTRLQPTAAELKHKIRICASNLLLNIAMEFSDPADQGCTIALIAVVFLDMLPDEKRERFRQTLIDSIKDGQK